MDSRFVYQVTIDTNRPMQEAQTPALDGLLKWALSKAEPLVQEVVLVRVHPVPTEPTGKKWEAEWTAAVERLYGAGWEYGVDEAMVWREVGRGPTDAHEQKRLNDIRKEQEPES